MTLYSSRVPNTDPYPYVGMTERGEFRTAEWSTAREPSDVFSPRPEFDHVPVATEGANPILVTRRLFGPGVNIMYANLPEWPTPDQIEHARKVLTRLAALES